MAFLDGLSRFTAGVAVGIGLLLLSLPAATGRDFQSVDGIAAIAVFSLSIAITLMEWRRQSVK